MSEPIAYCSRCPAFLDTPESLALGTCAGCRSPGPTRSVPAPLSPDPCAIESDVLALRSWAVAERNSRLIRVLDFFEYQSRLVIWLAEAAKRSPATPQDSQNAPS